MNEQRQEMWKKMIDLDKKMDKIISLLSKSSQIISPPETPDQQLLYQDANFYECFVSNNKESSSNMEFRIN